MKLRTYYLSTMIGLLLGGLLAGYQMGWHYRENAWVAAIMLAVLAGMGVCAFLAWRAGPEAATYNRVPGDFAPGVPAPDRVRYYKRILWMGVPAFIILAVWTGWDLHQLETGGSDYVRIPVPFNVVYDHFGLWPTVISILGLGVVVCGALLWKIRKLTRQP